MNQHRDLQYKFNLRLQDLLLMPLRKSRVLCFLLCKSFKHRQNIIGFNHHNRDIEIYKQIIEKRETRCRPVRPRDILVMIAPVTAKPTRNGQLRLHSLRKNTGHASNFLISKLRLLSSLSPLG